MHCCVLSVGLVQPSPVSTGRGLHFTFPLVLLLRFLLTHLLGQYGITWRGLAVFIEHISDSSATGATAQN